MWLSEQMKFSGNLERSGAETGVVSLGGAAIAVVTQGERRKLSMALPGGFRWQPALGQRVLVLTSTEGEAIVVGAIPEPDGTLEAGELEIQGENCAIRMKRGGEMLISGRSIRLSGGVDIAGGLSVNGEAYKPCTCVTGGV
ncbi:MAG: hypothetical protein ACOX81_02375 [Candidatus Heteroscillospira sp.]|jgi:hypothetical protein